MIDTNKDEVKSVIADIVAKEIIQGRQLDIEVLLSYFLSDLFFSHVQMRVPKTTAYYISPIEIRLLLAKIIYVKSHSNALGFDPQTYMK